LAIGSRAFQNGKKPILELSGNDMMFIWKDAVVHEAVRSLLDGFMGSTQICMVPKKAFIHEELYESFQSAFLSEIKTLRVGLPSDPNVSLSPVIKIPEFFEFLEDALAKGAELLCGGYRVDYMGQPDRHGQFLAPTVVRIKDLSKAYQMKCMREENFFPLIPLIRVTADYNGTEKSNKDMAIFKKMVHIANNNEYGLRISAWVTSPFYASRFSEQIQNSGLLRINSRHVGFPPFLATHGGTGKSGGPFGELNYVWQKTTHLQGVSLTRIKKRDE
jgi:acyl-CoA reductase-like NAD-dependent aldehyde dehydrogenase